MTRWTRWAVLVVAALLLAACERQQPVRIGFLAELTGRTADLAEAARNGVTLAVDQFREADTRQGRGIELLVRDSGPDAASARQAAEELIQARVDVIIGGTTSGMVSDVLPVVERAKVLLISPTASAIEFHGKDDMLFRINTTTRDNGHHYAAHYFQKGIRRLSIAVNENNRAFSESWLKEFRAAYEALGGAILATTLFDSGSTRHAEVIAALLQPRPDGLLFIGNAVDCARLAQQTHKLDPQIPLIAVEWAGTEQLIELGGRAVEGLMIVQNYNQDDSTDGYQQFQEAYRKRFGKGPVFGSVLAYDAAAVTLAALARRPPDMTAKEALIKFGPYEGLQQSIQFDANGDSNRSAYFMVIRNGRFVREP
mgnify:CR=1 FL=1